MTEDINTSRQSSDIHQPLSVLFSGKPSFLLNKQAKIEDCNDSFLGILNIIKSELLENELYESEQNIPFFTSFRKALTEGISIFHGLLHLTPSNREITIESVLLSSSQLNHVEKGVICYVINNKENLTEVHTGHYVSGLITNISDHTHASVSVHSFDGRAIYISPAIESLLGYSCTDLIESPALSIVYPEDLPVVQSVISKLRSGTDFLNSNYRMIHKNGSLVEIETSSYVITDESGTGKNIVNVSWDLGARRKMRHELELSEQKYYRLAMNLPAGVSLISRHGKLLDANDAMKKIMGMSLEIPLPEFNFFDFEVMKDAGISDQLKKCINLKDTVTGNIPFNSVRQGHEIFLNYSFIPILNHIGEVDTVIGYVSDQTQQIKAESDSRERADFLNLVIDAIKSPFFVKDESHKWVMLNAAAVDMMGQPRETLIGKSDYDIFPKEQADVFWKFDELVFNTGSCSNEEQITWSDGTIHTIVTYKQLYVENTSGKKFIVGTSHDISSYKKIEDELRASEMKYHELFDNANDFIITLDLDGNITNANRTLLNHLQSDLEQITKLNVYDFVSEENKEFAFSIKDKLFNGVLENPFELNATGNEKQQVTFEVKASIINHNGIPVGVQCVFSDVTERKEARLKLEKYNTKLVELNKTKDKFFSIIAHDLRNPYSSMIGFSELLLEDLEKLTTDEIRDSLKIIRNSAKNSLNLLENLLAWSRLETGRMPFDPARVNLFTIVDEVVNVLFSLAYRKKIEILNEVDPAQFIFADRNMLNTILNNLIMNAIKYTPLGGQIKISASYQLADPQSEKEFIRIDIADTGIGMEDEVCKNLFTANKSLSSPGTEKEQGTGLGLVLSREMVERHGGIITAESTLGKGSVFSFLIPV